MSIFCATRFMLPRLWYHMAGMRATVLSAKSLFSALILIWLNPSSVTPMPGFRPVKGTNVMGWN